MGSTAEQHHTENQVWMWPIGSCYEHPPVVDCRGGGRSHSGGVVCRLPIDCSPPTRSGPHRPARAITTHLLLFRSDLIRLRIRDARSLTSIRDRPMVDRKPRRPRLERADVLHAWQSAIKES